MSDQLFHPSTGLGGSKEKVNEAIIIPMFRTNDPITSKKAGKSAARRSPSQRMILLRAFVGGKGYTDEEAGEVTGLAKKPRCCYWKRLSELRADGLIAPTGDYAKSSAGELQRICRLTPKGEEYLRSLDN